VPEKSSVRTKLALKLALSLALLGLALSLVDLKRFGEVFRHAAPAWLTAAVVAWVVYQAVGASMASTMLGGAIGFGRAWRVNLISTYFGLFLPGDVVAGMASRLRYLGLSSWRDVVLFTLTERLVVLAAASAIAIPLSVLSSFMRTLGPLLALGPALVLTACLAALTVLRNPRVGGWAAKLLKRADLEAAVTVKPALSLAIWMVAAALSLLAGAVAWLTLRGFATEVSFADAFVFGYLTSIASLLPMFLAGIGIRDVSAIAFLALIGISREVALASSVVGLALLAVSGIVGGALLVNEERVRRA
jgi:uncharacterized membrane protein YbhN (UPF0104 family)